MIRRSFIFVVIVSLTAFSVIAQDEQPKGDPERAARLLTWTMSGDGGYLGVQTRDVGSENYASFGLSAVRGVAVEEVIEGSPAAAAGLQKGDVILRFNGEDVTSARKLTRLVSEVAPDHTVTMTVFRSGSEREMTVTIGKRPAPTFERGAFSMSIPKIPEIPSTPGVPAMPPMGELPGIFAAPRGDAGDVFVWRSGGSRQIGVGVTPLTKQLADHFGVANGVMINNVREDSPASRAGLRAGDIIVEVDGNEVKGDFDLIRAITEKKEGDVSLTIVRDRNRQTVTVTPEAAKDGLERLFEFREENDGPNRMRLTRPARPAAPMPLNQLFVPGRVI
jgi:serine protease Do